MDETTALRQKFEELQEQMASDDVDVLLLLVEAREGGLVSRHLDDWISKLRDDEVTEDEAIAWVEAVAEGADPGAHESGLHELSRPSSVEIDEGEVDDEVDFALVGESATQDQSDTDSDGSDAEEAPVVVELDDSEPNDEASDDEESQSELEPDEKSEEPRVEPDESESEESGPDASLFDDLGDMMAEAGKQALDEVRDFKLPKLKATKKLALSGDEKKKLSKRFSIPNPTRDVPALSRSDDSEDDGATPIAGLKALQGLVANSERKGSSPDESSASDGSEASSVSEASELSEASEGAGEGLGEDSSDVFGLGSLDLDELMEGADGDASSATSEDEGAAEPSTGDDSAEEPEFHEELMVGADLEIELDSQSEAIDAEVDLDLSLDDDPSDAEPGEPAADAGQQEPDAADSEPEDEDEPESAPSGGFGGGGSGMGSLFDDDELAEIEQAGREAKKEREGPSDGSTPGIRYDSGKSGARYAGKAPPPPTHRLRGGGSAGPAMTGFSVEDEEDDDDFDLDFGMGGADSGPSFGAAAQTAESSEISESGDDDDDDFDFDLGLENPESKASGSQPGIPIGQESSVSDDDDDFDFDLGFENPATKNREVGGTAPEGPEIEFDLEDDSLALELEEDSRGVTKGPPGFSSEDKQEGSSTEEREDYDALRRQAIRSDVVGREHQPTPMRQDAVQRPNRAQQPTPMAQDRTGGAGGGAGDIEQDEFDDLYESFDEPGQQYRGEPMVTDPSDAEDLDASPQRENPFAHEAPTGVRHAAVESSFVLEEVSVAEDSAGPNLSAILLEARRLYENGDFEQSMDIVQKVLSREKNDEAFALKQAIEGELERSELDKLGSLAKVPNLKVSMNEIPTLDLDHRAGFLLSQIDGMMTFEDLLELSSMSRYETLTVLSDLVEKDVIGVD